MTLHIKTLAGEPSVSLIECPSAGNHVEKYGLSKDPNRNFTKKSYEDSHFKFIGACIDQTKDQCNLMTCNVTEIFNRVKIWKRELPRVTPYYAVKCNTDLPLIKVLAASGVNFDCASKSEIDIIISKADVNPSRIIFANACKFGSHIRYAAKNGVQRTTFDNEMELTKLAKDWPNAECVLRILPEKFEAQCQLCDKFGCSPDMVPALLAKARELNLNVVGISFHVGSGCYEAKAWAESVRLARRVADDFFPKYDFQLKLLDIGGGYPGNSPETAMPDQPSFANICYHLREALDSCFPENSGVNIIAEPGRFFAASLYTAVTEVYGIRTVKVNEDIVNQVYTGDGVYGTFNNVIFDHQKVHLSAIISPGDQSPATTKKMSDSERSSLFKTKLFGPTCDGIDELSTEFMMMPKLDYGDWLVWRDMGAYTVSAASQFNGMPLPKMYYFLYGPTPKQLELVSMALDLGEPKDCFPLSITSVEREM